MRRRRRRKVGEENVQFQVAAGDRISNEAQDAMMMRKAEKHVI